jgi:zinc protease
MSPFPPVVLREHLPSGLTVLLVPRPGCGVVTAQAWVSTGAAGETPELAGVSHFLEHMVFKATKAYESGQIDMAVEGMGGLLNAETSQDYTCYYVTSAAHLLPRALDVLAELTGRALIREDDLNDERKVILEEYYRKQDNPQGVLWEELYARSFWTGPYRGPILGRPETIGSISREAMHDYYRRHYAPENTVLVIVGDVDPEVTLKTVGQAYADYDRPYAPILGPDDLRSEAAAANETVLSKDVQETYGVLAFPVPAMIDHRAAYARDVMQFLLGGGRASILYHEIKEKRRLASSIHAGSGNSRHPDLFYVYYTCEEEKRSALEEAVLEQIDRFQQSPPTSAAFARARNLLLNGYAFSLETTGGQASSIGFYYVVTGDTAYEANFGEGVAAVTADEVVEQARLYLRPESLTRVVVRPSGTGGGMSTEDMENDEE